MTRRWLAARHRREEHAVNVSRRRFTVNGNEFRAIRLTQCTRVKLWLVPDMKTKKKKPHGEREPTAKRNVSSSKETRRKPLLLD